MQLTPSQSFDHIKEAVVQYLETAYKIAHPGVVAERAAILRSQGTIAQSPFIEATPAFPTDNKLADLERDHPEFLPPGLAELVLHGVPVDKFPLYTHQQEALLAAFSDKPNLLVATGTGSGKTEAFLLPILADILREARNWSGTNGPQQRGEFDGLSATWQHERRHEQRPAAIRAIVLYPMNALVNDQLSRLRRILARGDSPDWQRANLDGNVIHFGMYTSLAKPTGDWHRQGKRTEWEKRLAKIEKDWNGLRPKLRLSGNWPRPDSPEMLCRWDMQAAPPDILVTNYSMLEYMLVRPIEAGMFEQTREWLAKTPDARLTLVLDEAHTYTGAKGTEVAHLVRRLKERLGIEPDSGKFRAIATSASIPDIPGADTKLLEFTSDLFGEPSNTFSLIRVKPADPLAPRSTTAESLAAFQRFQRSFDVTDPWPAIEQIAIDLQLGLVDKTVDPQVALWRLLESNEDIKWVRGRTARKATLLTDLADECWPGISAAPQDREEATAGVLAAGSFARSDPSGDTPPLLSMRVHGFFRGITGLWACMDPECTAVPPEGRLPGLARPIGKLYTEPQPWCECGARVLELFSCRKCGLLFLGGIPDGARGALWPWSDDLSGERQDLAEFQIFGVEPATPGERPDYRSTRSTLPVQSANDAYARSTWHVEPCEVDGKVIGPYPKQCPRCRDWRAAPNDPFGKAREIVENLRTKGPRSFSVVVEDGFRVQPRVDPEQKINHGRKALLFTDSRLEAAILAGDVRRDHDYDTFRQLLYRALLSCDQCDGRGAIADPDADFVDDALRLVPCTVCAGSGLTSNPTPLDFAALRARVIDSQLRLGINPTGGAVADYFANRDQGNVALCDEQARLFFEVALQRELSEDEFALEPLGLARWDLRLPQAFSTELEPLSPDETRLFLRIVARILATEHVLLRAEPAYAGDWPPEVKDYHRKFLVWAEGAGSNNQLVPYNLSNRRKLGRYVIALSRALLAAGRIPDEPAANKWVYDLRKTLWDVLRSKANGIFSISGPQVGTNWPMGIRIDCFELHPVGERVERCTACAYVMSEALLGVCRRCGQKTQPVRAGEIRNFYRRAAEYVTQKDLFDDPYPLRSIEHTAQIPGKEARDLERWFQDMFRDEENEKDFRVDVLSVTTTMEMGIDIGSLLCVGMRNVPPTVANYQQRSGRAGRRGSAVATVLTYAQNRSHDQYYFDRPPEIVSHPPRVPALHLSNDVIARRHARSLVLQAFFDYLRKNTKGGPGAATGLFGTWGTVGEFLQRQLGTRLRTFVDGHFASLGDRVLKIVDPELAAHVDAWLDALPGEVVGAAQKGNTSTELLTELLTAGLLPKYAFPVDVVSLNIPQLPQYMGADDEDGETGEAMQRDLRIAIAEYAPGAEVVRGSFPHTYIYRSMGIYDRFAPEPNYSATGTLVECQDCQAIQITAAGDTPPVQCKACESTNVRDLDYIKPPGFTIDAALNAPGEQYEGGGRERSGYAAPARLLPGETSFSVAGAQTAFAPALHAHVKVGELVTCNKGPNKQFPGYRICPDCGRWLHDEEAKPGLKHRRPSQVWPPYKGARAGSLCPNTKDFENWLVLAHPFTSEVCLLGVNLPSDLDAPLIEPSGRAVWYSFGTLMANAATRVLQLDPGELKVGVRPVKRPSGRIHGEAFLYDDVPGGAGYARAVHENLEEICRKALELGQNCFNPDCPGACYRCLYDYRNQMLHPVLNRHLGAAVLNFLINGTKPTLTPAEIDTAVASLTEYARGSWQTKGPIKAGQYEFPAVLEDGQGTRIAVWPIHPLAARPTDAEKQSVVITHGLRPAVHTTFDLLRRPFWVMDHLLA